MEYLIGIFHSNSIHNSPLQEVFQRNVDNSVRKEKSQHHYQWTTVMHVFYPSILGLLFMHLNMTWQVMTKES